MHKKTTLIAAAVVAVGALWYAFRPERLFINKTVSEGFPTELARAAVNPGQPSILAAGRFHDGAHATSGSATIYQLQDRKRSLRLTEFETSNGPDVQVYLVAAADAKDNATVTNAGFIPLGAMKGNKGDQNYEVPSDVDLSKYRAVTIWCRRFGVNFGTAPLSAQNQMSSNQMSSMDSKQAAALLATGRFHDGAHKTSGSAMIYNLKEGKRVLRLTDFETSNGPDVQLYLVAAADATDNETVTRAGFVSLGPLRGNRGDQNYEIPSNLDLARYRAVTVWCRRFSVNFGTAPLTQQ